MKKNRSIQIIAGLSFFVLAVFFSFSLLTSVFLNQSAQKGFSAFLHSTGALMTSSYGVSSILIPIFFFVVSMVCLIANVTFKTCVYISFSLIPFFTAVISEKIFTNSTTFPLDVFSIIKLIITFVATLLIMAIEYLLSGIIAERLVFNKKLKLRFLNSNKNSDFGNRPIDSGELRNEANISCDNFEIADNDSNFDDSQTKFVNSNTELDDEKFSFGENSTRDVNRENDETQYDTKLLHEFDNLDLETKNDSYLEDFEQNKISSPFGQINPQATLSEALTLEEENSLVGEIDFDEENLDTDTDEFDDDEIDFNTNTAEVDDTEFNTNTGGIDDDTNLNTNTPALDTAGTYDDNRDSGDLDTVDFDDENVDTSDATRTVIIDDYNDKLNEEVNQYENFVAEDLAEEIIEPIFDDDENDADEENDGEIVEDDDDIIDDAEELDAHDSDTVDFNDIATTNSDALISDTDNADAPNSMTTPNSTVETNINESHGLTGIFSKMENDIRKKLASENGSNSSASNLASTSASNAQNGNAPTSADNSTPASSPTTRASNTNLPETKEEKKAPPRRTGLYKIPTEGLLNEFEDKQYWIIDEKTNEAAALLKETLKEFKIAAEVTGIRKGPVVTMFEILPAPGVKLNRIVQLQDNIALRLAASSIRIVAPIPGKKAVGIEIPNEDRAIVTFRELIEQNLPEYKKMSIPFVLGKDIQGEAQLFDIAKTPHLLIAGSTGSGKSVCVNSIILSILYKKAPSEVKLILIDPKIVELKLYNDIPHLLTPVITEPKKALQALQYCICEMERRYSLLDSIGVRDIINYNKRIEERHIAQEKLPYIVVIIDEFADLMATTRKELETTIARLCAMSRAVGIHLVLATQRPSIDVITGLIKANIPTRIAFMVASKTDSRIIIDQVGAEKLLGRGDMLFASAIDPYPVRIQGTFITDDEVEHVVEYVKGYGEPDYIDDEIFIDDEEDELGEPTLFGDEEDPLYNKALQVVIEAGRASASYIQRRLRIGYNRAARLIEEMEERGVIGPPNGSKPREIINVR